MVVIWSILYDLTYCRSSSDITRLRLWSPHLKLELTISLEEEKLKMFKACLELIGFR